MGKLSVYPIKSKDGKWVPFHRPTNQVLRGVPFDTEEECKEWIKKFEDKLNKCEVIDAIRMRWEPISSIEGWEVIGIKKGGVFKGGEQVKKIKSSIQEDVDKVIYEKE